MIENKRIVITGGAGFIGAHLSRALAANNTVVIFDDLSTGSEDAVRDVLGAGRAELVRGDVSRPGDLSGAFDGADVVFHLAVLNLRECMTRPERALEVNAAGAMNAALEAARAGAKKYIHVSTSDIYGDIDVFPAREDCLPKPTTMYGATKLAGELAAAAVSGLQGLPLVIVRPFNTYGPGEHVEGTSGEVLPRFILYALAGLPLPVYGYGRQTRGFTHISDTVRGLIAAAECASPPRGPVNIASSEEVQIIAAARAVNRLLGRPEDSIEHLAARPGDVARQLADVSLAEEHFGFRARLTFDEGLPSLVEWVRSLNIPLEKAPKIWPGGAAYSRRTP